MIRFLPLLAVEKVGRFAFGNRSGVASPLSRQAASQPSGRSSTIAGACPELLAILACLAIWGGTFLAIGRL